MIARPDQDGGQQLRLLDDAWGRAAEHWRDGTARQFGAAQLTPLLQESAATWRPSASCWTPSTPPNAKPKARLPSLWHRRAGAGAL